MKAYEQQIGELVRDGETIFYATLSGALYVENRKREEIEALVKADNHG
jgi:hypothetical protein